MAHGRRDHCALATWRDAGGYVGLKLGELYWDEFHVKVYDGLLKLDRALQPTGSFMASATNEATAVDAMVAAGGLSAQEADAVKAILASLVQPAADGSPHLLQKVQIGNNRMTLGATEIFALPRIVWP